MLGNPPWIKVEWEEGGILGDHNPLFVLRRHLASEITALRGAAFTRYPHLPDNWRAELEQAEATQRFLNAQQNYPLLAGQQTNLYKCFLPQAWMVQGKSGVAGLLHPDGIYDDPNGGVFRKALYTRLRAHFRFQNERKLFPEVHNDVRPFSINIYGKLVGSPTFIHVASLFSPVTLDASLEHDGTGPVPGIKDDDDKWNLVGHAQRIIDVDLPTLEYLAKLYDEAGTQPLRARLPALHARTLLSVLQKFAGHSAHLGDLQGRVLRHCSLARDDESTRRYHAPRDALSDGAWSACLIWPAFLRRQSVKQDASPDVQHEQELRCPRSHYTTVGLPASHELCSRV